MIKRLILFAALALSLLPASAATLLPNGKQQFFGINGAPLIGGSVTFYIPGTSTPKDTFQDSLSTIPNTNPVHLDSLGSAIIYGTGCYRQIVQDSLNNLVWDQQTCDTSSTGEGQWGGISGGTVNAQTVVDDNFSTTDGQQITFQAGLTNTAAMTLTPSGTGTPISVVNDSPTGNVALVGGQIVTGNIYTVTYSANTSSFHVTIPPSITAIIPSGAMMDFAGPNLPAGWLWANGACVNQASYPALFTAIGGIYGNCGAGTFVLPDFRGRATVGVDNMGGVGAAGRLTSVTIAPNAVTLGGAGGGETNSIAIGQLPVFTPTGTVSVGFPGGASYFESVYVSGLAGTGSAVTVTTGTSLQPTGAIGPATFTVSMNSVGSGNPFPIVQPSLLVNKIIKQ